MKSIHIFGLLIVGVAALKMCGESENNAAAKAKFKLDSAGSEVYDSCHSDMARVKLKNGGNNENFCGCVAHDSLAQIGVDHKDDITLFIEDFASSVGKLNGSPPDFNKFFKKKNNQLSTAPTTMLAIMDRCNYQAGPKMTMADFNAQYPNMSPDEREALRQHLIGNGSLRE